MRRVLALVWLLASLSLAALGQAYTTVTASNVTVDNGSGSAVNPPSGSSLCFLGVNNSGAPITYTPSGGSPVSGTVCQTLNSSGALTGTLQIANPATASPLGLLYTITVVNGSTTYLTIPTVGLSGTIFNFDSFSLPGTSSANGIGKAHLACASGAQWSSTTLPPGQNNQRCNTSGLWDSYPPANYCPAGMAYLVPQQGGTPICQAPTLEGNGAPSGSCFEKSTYLDVTGGGFYACTNGAWSLKSSSSPGVTSIQGAAGAFVFTGSGFSNCSTSGGTTTCTFTGGAGGISGQASGVVPLAGSATTLTSQSHINENTPGTTAVTQQLTDTSSVNSTPAGIDTNTGTSSDFVYARASTCPNVTSGTFSGCGFAVGLSASPADGNAAVVNWLRNSTLSLSRGALTIATNTIFHPTPAFEWDLAGNTYLPNLLSQRCLGTDSGGKVGGGTGCSFTLTTTGTSGPATFSGGILNIPQYSGGTVTFSGDLSGTSGGPQTVVGIQGKTLPTLARGYLFYDGSAMNWTGLPSMVVSSSTSITLACGQWIRATSSSAITITVPAPSAATGMCQSVIERGTGAGAITISPAGGTYDGASANLQQGQAMTVLNDGTNWHSTSPIIPGGHCTWTPGLTGNTLDCSGGSLSGMTAGQVAIAATASTVTSSKAIQGTDASLLSSGTISGIGSSLCTDANGGATTVGCSAGGGGLSGQTTNYLPKATSATASTTSSVIEDQGTAVVLHTSGTGFGVSWPEGTAISGVAGQDILYADSGSHTVKLSTNGGAASSICTAGNGLCSSTAPPQWQGYTFVADSTAASVTSPSMSVTAGELLVVNCRFGTGSACTVTDSGSNTWHALSSVNNSGVLNQMSWAIAAATGSVTFTVTQSSSVAGLSLVAMHYSGAGSSLNTSATGTSTTTSAFTTTQRTLNVYCVSIGALTTYQITQLGVWNSAGVSQSAINASNADQGCAWSVSNGQFYGAANPITAGSGNSPASSVLAFNF